jgi:hypothetical protein
MAATTQMPNTHSIVIPAKAGIQTILSTKDKRGASWPLHIHTVVHVAACLGAGLRRHDE